MCLETTPKQLKCVKTETTIQICNYVETEYVLLIKIPIVQNTLVFRCFFEFFLESTPNKGCIVTFLQPAFSTTTFCHRITLNILKHPSCNVLFTMLRM